MFEQQKSFIKGHFLLTQYLLVIERHRLQLNVNITTSTCKLFAIPIYPNSTNLTKDKKEKETMEEIIQK
jgi:hypothetical protein